MINKKQNDMNELTPLPQGATTRRAFLRTSTAAAAGAALTGAFARPGYAAEDSRVKIALIGCGGRGSGAAAQALSTKGPVQLWATADVFAHRMQGSLNGLKQQHPEKADVPPERQFIGMDAFKKAIDSLGKGGVALLTTPPAFRPIHFEYAVQQGCHVFMEKSFAVDGPGIRRVLRVGEQAKEKEPEGGGRADEPALQAVGRSGRPDS